MTRNFSALLRNFPMKNPATPLHAKGIILDNKSRFTSHLLSFAPQDILKYTLSEERLRPSYAATI
jgi:hypothetical protein